jgi:hypothetical protein
MHSGYIVFKQKRDIMMNKILLTTAVLISSVSFFTLEGNAWLFGCHQILNCHNSKVGDFSLNSHTNHGNWSKSISCVTVGTACEYGASSLTQAQGDKVCSDNANKEWGGTSKMTGADCSRIPG